MSIKHRREPYMPDSDLGKRMWMERFITGLERDPQRYGFDDAVTFELIQRTIRTFIKAAHAVANPAARSPSATLVKNEARAKAVALCRDIAMRLKFDASLSEDEKRSLGINTWDAPVQDAKLPQGVLPGTLGYPALAVVSSPNGGHVIRYSDITTPSKAKPKGVSHLLLFGAIGEKPNMRRTHARLLGAYTKRPFEIRYPVSCGIEGLYVTYYGRWLTTRGQMSPWSQGVSKIIGETQVSLRDSDFAHLFEKQGFIDALPQGLSEDRLLLEDVAHESDGLLAALESKMDAKTLPWQAFALLETKVARCAAEVKTHEPTENESPRELSGELPRPEAA